MPHARALAWLRTAPFSTRTALVAAAAAALWCMGLSAVAAAAGVTAAALAVELALGVHPTVTRARLFTAAVYASLAVLFATRVPSNALAACFVAVAASLAACDTLMSVALLCRECCGCARGRAR